MVPNALTSEIRKQKQVDSLCNEFQDSPGYEDPVIKFKKKEEKIQSFTKRKGIQTRTRLMKPIAKAR